MQATLGMWDTLILMVLALVVFGPRRLPMIGRQLGKLMYEFRKASNDFKFQMEEELRQAEEADRRRKEEERQRALAAPPPLSQAELAAAQAAGSGIEAAEAEPQATVSSADAYAAVTADPYVEGATRVESNAPTNGEAASSHAEIAVADAVEAAKLRIQPPSTGQKVAAAAPNQPLESVLGEAERSEPTAHHG